MRGGRSAGGSSRNGNGEGAELKREMAGEFTGTGRVEIETYCKGRRLRVLPFFVALAGFLGWCE